MTKLKQIFWAATLAVAVSLALGGCDRLRNYTDEEHVRRAKDFEAKTDHRAALLELKNALQKNPKNKEARLLLGELYLKMGDGKSAEKEFLKAKDLGVGEELLRVLLGQALLKQHSHKRILDEIQPSPSGSASNTAQILYIRGEAMLATPRRLEEGCNNFRRAIELDASYAYSYLGLAKCLMYKGEQAGAGAQIEKATQLEPKNPDLWSARGEWAWGQDQIEQAEKDFTAALKLDESHLVAMVSRATLRLDRGQLDKVQQDVGQLEKLHGKHPLALQVKGMLQYRKGKYSEAKTSFDKVLKADPNYMPAVLWRGLSNYALGSVEEASQEFSRYLGAVPGASEVRALLAYIAAVRGNKVEAAEALKQLGRMDFSNPQSLALLGRAHLELGDLGEGIRYLRRVIEQDPQTADTHVALGVALLRKGDTNEAFAELARASELSPEDTRPDIALVKALIDKKQYDQALEAIKRIKQKAPKDVLANNLRGMVFVLQGKEAEAAKEFRQALSVKKGDPDAAHNLALMALRKKDYPAARDLYTQVLQVNPKHITTLLAIYGVETQMGRSKEALAYLETAANISPRSPEVAVLRAREHIAAGMPEKAINATQAALEAQPTHAGLLEVRGAAYLSQGDGTSAAANFRKLVEAKPDSADTYFWLSQATALRGDVAATRDALAQALKLAPKHVRAKAALARMQIASAKTQEAIKLAQEIQVENPTIPEGMLIEADALAVGGRLQDAIKLLERAKARFPEQAPVILDLAGLRWKAGEKEAALSIAKDWIKAHPKEVRAHLFLGEAYGAMGKARESAAAYEAILGFQPNHATAMNNAAWSLRLVDPAKALKYAEQAYRLAPKSEDVADTYGVILLAQGKGSLAEEVLKKAFERNSRNSSLRLHFALALEKVGKIQEARRIALPLAGVKFPGQAESQALLARIR